MSSSSPANVDPSERCLYPNKPCWNPRTVKRNGELHRLCELHRDNAIRNHRRWHENRRRQARAKRLPRFDLRLLHESPIETSDDELHAILLPMVSDVDISAEDSFLELLGSDSAIEDEELMKYLDEKFVLPDAIQTPYLDYDLDLRIEGLDMNV